MKDKNTEHGQKFSFNENVTSCFDDMLERSIPSYDWMRELTVRIANHYMENKEYNHVVDLGTSTGEVISRLYETNPLATYTGFESSEAMVAEAQKRFSGNKKIKIELLDIKKKIVMPSKVDMVVSSLTIQFTPIEYRLNIIKSIYDILNTNGVFIFIEKVMGSSAQIDNDFISIYYDIKKENGYSEEEIQRKKLALEGVLVPVTAKWNEEMLKMSGFTQIDCFWRCLNFCGWVAIK